MFTRIVSFLPSATEILYLLECQDSLYGVTHQCNFPSEARNKPQVVRSVFDSESMTSLQIEEKIQEIDLKSTKEKNDKMSASELTKTEPKKEDALI